VGADGSLTSAGTTALLSNGGGLAITRDGKFLYVCTATKGLYGFSLGSNGAPSTLPGFPMTNRSCDDVAITPNGHFLVTVESGIGVRVYSPGGTGALTDVSGPTLIGPNPNSIEIAPDGKNFYIENIGSGSLSGTIAQFNLAADGTATHFGTDAVLTVPTVFANGLAISPDGRYIVATVNTVTSNILVFATNGGGQLTPAPGSPASSGASMAAGSPLQEVVFRTNQGPSVTRVSDTGSDRSRTFSAVGATDPDGSVGSYVWDFGDGSTSTTTTAAVKHKYAKNRIYNVSVSVVDDENCGASDIFDGRKYFCNASGGSTATTAADVLPPVFSKLKLSKKSASSGSKLKLSYKLSEAAKVKVTFQLRSGKKYKSKGSLTFASKSGKRSKKLTLKIKGKKLPVGKYRVLVAGTDGAKNTSSAKRLKLTVR
jgi:sugar lactone lactonase YvrE